MGQPIEDDALAAVGQVQPTEDHPWQDAFEADKHGKHQEEQPVPEDRQSILLKALAAFIDAQMIFVHDHDLQNLGKRQVKYIAAQREYILLLGGEAELASINEQTIISQTALLKTLGVI